MKDKKPARVTRHSRVEFGFKKEIFMDFIHFDLGDGFGLHDLKSFAEFEGEMTQGELEAHRQDGPIFQFAEIVIRAIRHAVRYIDEIPHSGSFDNAQLPENLEPYSEGWYMVKIAKASQANSIALRRASGDDPPVDAAATVASTGMELGAWCRQFQLSEAWKRHVLERQKQRDGFDGLGKAGAAAANAERHEKAEEWRAVAREIAAGTTLKGSERNAFIRRELKKLGYDEPKDRSIRRALSKKIRMIEVFLGFWPGPFRHGQATHLCRSPSHPAPGCPSAIQAASAPGQRWSFHAQRHAPPPGADHGPPRPRPDGRRLSGRRPARG